MLKPLEKCLLSNNIMDYHVVAQGKTSIPGVDDGEELELTDVRVTTGLDFNLARIDLELINCTFLFQYTTCQFVIEFCFRVRTPNPSFAKHYILHLFKPYSKKLLTKFIVFSSFRYDHVAA